MHRCNARRKVQKLNPGKCCLVQTPTHSSTVGHPCLSLCLSLSRTTLSASPHLPSPQATGARECIAVDCLFILKNWSYTFISPPQFTGTYCNINVNVRSPDLLNRCINEKKIFSYSAGFNKLLTLTALFFVLLCIHNFVKIRPQCPTDSNA